RKPPPGTPRSSASAPVRSSSAQASWLLPFLPEVPFEFIQPLAPEPLILVHPTRDQPQRLRPERNHHLPPLPLPRNQTRTLQQLEVFRHRVERQVERPRDIRKPRRSARQPPDDRAPRRMRYRRKHVRKLIDIHIHHSTASPPGSTPSPPCPPVL